MEKIEIKKLLSNFEISNKMDRYLLVVSFLSFAGKQFYIRQMDGESASAEEIKVFTDKIQEFKESVDKLLGALPVTKS